MCLRNPNLCIPGSSSSRPSPRVRFNFAAWRRRILLLQTQPIGSKSNRSWLGHSLSISSLLVPRSCPTRSLYPCTAMPPTFVTRTFVVALSVVSTHSFQTQPITLYDTSTSSPSQITSIHQHPHPPGSTFTLFISPIPKIHDPSHHSTLPSSNSDSHTNIHNTIKQAINTRASFFNSENDVLSRCASYIPTFSVVQIRCRQCEGKESC